MYKVITAALPYSYSTPHVGNFVGSILPADIFYKYNKIKGEDAIFICGSDEHGTPMELEAIKRNMPPDQLAEQMHNKIKSLFERYNCSFTYYGKTHCEANKLTVYEIFEALDKNNYIVETESIVPFCNVDNRFLVDKLIEGTCPYCGYEHARGDQCENCGRLLDPTQLINPKCKICGKSDISFKRVKNLAIALDKFSSWLESYIKDHDSLWTKNAVNKALSYIKEGLRPRDITRHMKWGFSVNKQGFEDLVFYVWFDALIGYIGITRDYTKDWEKYWKDQNNELIQFFGKDNIEFHTLMFPSLLKGSNLGFILPNRIKAMEYLLFNNKKISKSQHIGIDLEEALKYMDADYWRFLLAYIIPENGDTSLDKQVLIDAIDKNLNDNIGNLINRVLNIAYNEKIDLKKFDNKILEGISNYINKYISDMDSIKIKDGLRDAIGLAEFGNEYLSSSEPWKKNGEEKGIILNTSIVILYYLFVLLWPFIPKKSEEGLKMLGIDISNERIVDVNTLLKDISNKIKISLKDRPKPIFNKTPKELVAIFS